MALLRAITLVNRVFIHIGFKLSQFDAPQNLMDPGTVAFPTDSAVIYSQFGLLIAFLRQLH